MMITSVCALILIAAMATIGCSDGVSTTEPNATRDTLTVTPYGGTCGFTISTAVWTNAVRVRNAVFNQSSSSRAIRVVANGVDKT